MNDSSDDLSGNLVIDEGDEPSETPREKPAAANLTDNMVNDKGERPLANPREAPVVANLPDNLAIDEGIFDSLHQPVCFSILQKHETAEIARLIGLYVDKPLNTSKARQGFTGVMKKLNKANLTNSVFPGIVTLLARASAQGCAFRVRIGRGPMNPQLFCFLNDHLSPENLFEPLAGISSQLCDNSVITQALAVFLVIKNEEFRELLAMCRKPLPVLSEVPWLSRAIFDSARSEYDQQLLKYALQSSNGDSAIPNNLLNFPRKRGRKRQFE